MARALQTRPSGRGVGKPGFPTLQPPLGAPGIPVSGSGGNPRFPMFALDGHAHGAQRRDDHGASLGGPPPPWPSPAGVQGRTERMSADGRYGVGMRCLVLTPSPSPASLERGDQSYARGRSNAVYATLARMFCPPLNPLGEGTGRLPAGRGLGKPGFPMSQPLLGAAGAPTGLGKPGFPVFSPQKTSSTLWLISASTPTPCTASRLS